MSGLSSPDFDLLATTLKNRSGLVLGPEKMYLLESRLTPLARRRGLPGLVELVKEMRQRPTEELLSDITGAMTTNETFFFRDSLPFDTLRDHVLPALKEARSSVRKLRIWCAAASTGQEPYSIAMTFHENAPQWAGWNIEILGTDLSVEALAKAKSATYSQFEVQRGLPIKLMMRYFTKNGDSWQLTPEIQSMVKFKIFNLLDPMNSMGTFDIIFCRNVLIYFDAPTKSRVLEALHNQLASDGSLFLGAAETVLGLSKALRPVREWRGLYVPVDASKQYAVAG